MTQEQFIYWLRGFLSGKNYICTQDIDLLKEELAKVTVITYTPSPYTWPGATWCGVDTASSQSSYVPSSHPSCHGFVNNSSSSRGVAESNVGVAESNVPN